MLALLLLVAPGPPVPAGWSTTPVLVVEVRGGDAHQHARLRDALGRFRDAGLQLPDLAVAFSDDKAACGGSLGRFDPTARPWRITVCREVGFVITHELAHAWIRAEVGPAERQRYLDARGLARWRDPGDPWAERGTEDAATVMHLVLLARDPDVSSPAWRERRQAYRLLTGRLPPVEGVAARPAGNLLDLERA